MLAAALAKVAGQRLRFPRGRRASTRPAGGPPGRALAVAAAVSLLAACGGGGAPASSPGTPASTAGSSTPGGTASASTSPAAGAPPGIVAVTKAGALVELDPATGSVTKTLVAGGVIGDEVSVSSDGSIVYFATHHGGCSDEIESVPMAGGSTIAMTQGLLPAVSPDGTKLAFAREPSPTVGCVPNVSNLTAHYKLVIRALDNGTERVLPMLPASQASGLPAPISHLSWAQDSTRLAVSISSVQDNEGWAVVIVNTDEASYYEGGTGDSAVPVTGHPNARASYYREGVFLPDGHLFVSRACCGGVPVRNTSRLMWEVNTGGALTHQVAIGYVSLEHTSLAANSAGSWLLYLAGNDLYVSRGGNTPTKLRTGLVAAAWQ